LYNSRERAERCAGASLQANPLERLDEKFVAAETRKANTNAR